MKWFDESNSIGAVVAQKQMLIHFNFHKMNELKLLERVLRSRFFFQERPSWRKTLNKPYQAVRVYKRGSHEKKSKTYENFKLLVYKQHNIIIYSTKK